MSTVINLSRLPCYDEVDFLLYPEGYWLEINDFGQALQLVDRIYNSLKSVEHGKLTLYIMPSAMHFGIFLKLQKLFNEEIALLVLSGNVYIDMQDFQK